MTPLREAAQQALEALKVATTPLAKDRQEVLRAQDALRAALAQQAEPKGGGRLPPPLQTEPVPQPGVWMHPWPPVRAQQAEPVQEPVAWRYQHSVIDQEYLTWEKGTVGRNWTPLYTAPPHCPNCASLKDNWK